MKQMLDMSMNRFHSYIEIMQMNRLYFMSGMLHHDFLVGAFYERFFNIPVAENRTKESRDKIKQVELLILETFGIEQDKQVVEAIRANKPGDKPSDKPSVKQSEKAQQFPMRSSISSTATPHTFSHLPSDASSHARCNRTLQSPMGSSAHTTTQQAWEIPLVQKAFRGGYPTSYIYNLAARTNNPWARIVTMEHDMAEHSASGNKKVLRKVQADIASEITTIFKMVYEDSKRNRGRGGELSQQADRCMKAVEQRHMKMRNNPTNLHVMVYDIMFKYPAIRDMVEDSIMTDLAMS
jgi:hypothetical protein